MAKKGKLPPALRENARRMKEGKPLKKKRGSPRSRRGKR